MLATCKDIADAMERFAPPVLREDWDNVGLLLGSFGQSVSKVLVTLDVLDNVVEEALANRADMIVSHHPVIFKGVKRLNDGDKAGKRLLTLIRSGIAVYAAHTNLDAAEGGTNDVLFDALGLLNKEGLKPSGHEGYPFACGRVGNLPEATTLAAFAARVRGAVSAEYVTYSGEDNAPVRRVGLCTGAGAAAEYFALAKEKGCDAYVTGDVTHHAAQAALDMGLCVVDATHYYTEMIVNEAVRGRLTRFCAENGLDTEIIVSRADGRMLKLMSADGVHLPKRKEAGE